MLSENEFDAFFGFSDPSEVTQPFFSASLQSTTQNVSSINLERSLITGLKNAIFPQGNAIVAIVRRCCAGVFECNDSLSHRLPRSHANTSWQFMRQFPQRRTLKNRCWGLKKKRKKHDFFTLLYIFFEKYFYIFFRKIFLKIRKKFGKLKTVKIVKHSKK